MAKELRITFKASEEDLYNYIYSKSSASAFLKDLAKLEQKREEIYLNNYLGFLSQNHQSSTIEGNSSSSSKRIEDLDISDLG